MTKKLLIGLGNGVAVNSLLGLSTICSWDSVLDVTNWRTIYDAFNIWFPIVFHSVYSGFPRGIEFKYSDLCRPQNNSPVTVLVL